MYNLIVISAILFVEFSAQQGPSWTHQDRCKVLRSMTPHATPTFHPYTGILVVVLKKLSKMVGTSTNIH